MDNKINDEILLGVPIYNQRELGYPTGCEMISTAMMINFWAEVDVHDLVSHMPRDMDPYKGFRGDPTTDGGFTVFPSALVDVVGACAMTATDMSGCEMDDLKAALSGGAPVVAWVSGLGFGVHAICLAGYDADGFHYNDPWTGQRDHLKYDEFYSIWNKPIYDDVYEKYYDTRKALCCTKENS